MIKWLAGVLVIVGKHWIVCLAVGPHVDGALGHDRGAERGRRGTGVPLDLRGMVQVRGEGLEPARLGWRPKAAR